jgi:predicted NACHT family NTPase
MSLPEDFLTQLEQYKELSQRERDVFLEMFGRGKSRVQVAQYLNISESALSTCLTGIYKKFRISDSGPIKENRLREYLTKRCLQPKNFGFSTRDDLDCDIDALVQEIREKVKPNIRERCGTMRVLDMNQPIGLGEIYTNVNILEKPTRTSERERHIPGLEAIERFSKLMILGKPGAGKTTFLKHLAIQCISGEFQAERLPVFVTLKDFAKTDENSDLLEYLVRSILINPLKTPNFESLQNVVRAGRALILLDGLDEVRDADSDWVLRQIQDLLKFSQNKFVITCRITSREYTFEQFTKVEIADFDDEQIAYFSGKWFDPIKAKHFQQKLKENERLRELAKNPLLLTLLCLVFEDPGSFPTNRASLYQQCVEQLLRKWNPLERECDPIYKKLSPDYREELISEIAWKTFERGNFNQREVKEQIREYIRSLPGISPEDLLKLDSKAVLESIEAQHGLLEEQTRGSYSFSHLTFHEYFTANKIVTSVGANGCLPLEVLVTHITEPRWREVFLLAVEMLDGADELLLLMKQRVDKIMLLDGELEKFINWIKVKSDLVATPYKRAIIRACYFNIILNRDIIQTFKFIDSLDQKCADALDQLYDTALDNSYQSNIDIGLIIANHLGCDLDLGLTRVLNYATSNILDDSAYSFFDYRMRILFFQPLRRD